VDAEHSDKEGQQGSDHTVAGFGVAHDEESSTAFGTFPVTGFGFSAAIGAVIYAEAPFIIALFAGIFLVCQFCAAISAKHKIYTFLFTWGYDTIFLYKKQLFLCKTLERMVYFWVKTGRMEKELTEILQIGNRILLTGLHLSGMIRAFQKGGIQHETNCNDS
jgi:hypothetical protein